ncbi:protein OVEREXPRESSOR OF CATIONIC PEROXIDASE 3 isoform X2 [Gastrolobium bilobum]|uniref:protein OVEREXPRESSOR OF CATIONIC PEROXIDASE 3 isoform X2 n=1 Tax=Gastrolobium bilobum TaxID=150636 RepID=UPI002AB086A0|nr:protein OVEREXPRESSOR OF CATIONIC PEROXIDASE 3 isoform X2 [Gastrolobium bilobum]
MGMAVQGLSCAQSERFLAPWRPIPLQRKPLFCSVFLPSRPRNLCSSIVAASSKNKNKGDNEDEDAFELLFKQLEEDLKNDDLSKGDSNDDITEEDIAIFERELEDALGDYDTELLNSEDINDTETGDDPENGNDDGDERSLKLRNWQLKKLAQALKTGRRKTSIKNLAAELCLDRALVLGLLRDPPPNLLMMSLSLPDEPTETITSLETKPRETVHKEISMDRVDSGPKSKEPIHTMQRSWSAQKRLKKAQVDTLERVYRRSKRPTDAMISSIVHVTNIPRKRVVKWFEDKRNEEGVPDRRIPYQRSVPETS